MATYSDLKKTTHSDLNQEVHVGIDVSSTHLDVDLYPHRRPCRIAYNAAGLKQLEKQMRSLNPTLIVLEATGGYEIQVAEMLAAACLPFAIVNPGRVRAFANSHGILAKTDKVDASVIAFFGERNRPPATTLADADAQEITGLVTRRKQLVEMRTMESNRLRLAHRSTRPSIEQHIAWIDRQIQEIDDQIRKQVASKPEWNKTINLLRSAPGIGPVVSSTLVAALPELGQISSKKLASLVGVAPFKKESGRTQKRACIYAGRTSVRAALYMATLTAVRFNPNLKDFYTRLLAAGKLKKVALTACMRKLLCILNTMVKTQQIWQMNPTRA